METQNSVVIKGELDRVFSYAAAVERWPEILPHYRRVTILQPGARERLVSMECVRAFGPIRYPCKWRALQRLAPEDARIHFSHVAGPVRGMGVEWVLEETPEGVRTSIRHWMDAGSAGWRKRFFSSIAAPMFVAVIANQTLATLKAIIEGESL